MTTLGSPEFLHIVLLLVMIVLLATRHSTGRRDNAARMAAERATLRAGLLAELVALRRIFRMNADLLGADAPQCFPGRPFFSIYRGCTGKLLLLSAPEMAAVVTAHASAEAVDHAVTLRVRLSRRDASAMENRVLNVTWLQRSARTDVDEAIAVLEAAIAAPAPMKVTFGEKVRTDVGQRWRWAVGGVSGMLAAAVSYGQRAVRSPPG